MLTLILAQPRTGKSQLAVKLGLEHRKEGKRVFVTNFNQTDEQRAESGFEKYDTPREWWGNEGSEFAPAHPEWVNPLPHGSVWIVDEAQDIFPQRGKDTPLPDFIKLFSKHGHHDLTIYILTQDASQLDVHLRRNTNITLHMTRPLMMRKANIYTFRGYQELPNDAWRRSQVWKSAESKKTFKYSKKFQRLYVSASAHESIKPRIPLKLLLLPALVLIVGYLLFWSYKRITSKGDDEKPSAVGVVAAAVTGAAAPTAATASSSPSQVALTTEQWIAQWEPRVKNLPSSAPAYDQFPVTDYPRLNCIIGGEKDSFDSTCKCFTQQASRLDIEDEQCRTYVLSGVWDPKKPIVQMEPQGQGGEPARDKGSSVSAPATAVVQAGQMTGYGGFRSSVSEPTAAPVQ